MKFNSNEFQLHGGKTAIKFELKQFKEKMFYFLTLRSP